MVSTVSADISLDLPMKKSWLGTSVNVERSSWPSMNPTTRDWCLESSTY